MLGAKIRKNRGILSFLFYFLYFCLVASIHIYIKAINNNIYMKLHLLFLTAIAFIAPQAMKASGSMMPNTSINYSCTAADLNTEKLQSAISEAEAIIANANNYLPGLVNDLSDVLFSVRKIVDSATTQTQINQAVARLNTSISKAKASEGKTFDAGNANAVYDTNRGFIHPGGLHTQADFDRIKKQLANGNKKVTEAMNKLRMAEYAQPTAGTYPTETIVRGGSGENYINTCRGAAIAYQNALRWKIEDNQACAKHAVEVLMKWCNTTKNVTGSSDQFLAFGLYGYQFAQAAELMRDYEGWKPADFEKFKQWMLNIWYQGAIDFLRRHNGTWENSGKWWQAPGHYWSNWGLCNAMCVLSIGVLCDDVFIYNQGLGAIKYDQVGTFKNPRTDNPILADGLTEFLGNFVVTTYPSDLETGAYGKLGQLNESGRDAGHAAMSLGLAVDIAHQIWNQGDDLFAYMDHRLAAGIEYLAAQTQSVEGLPWVNYHYYTNGFYYTDSRSWLMTGPAMGAQMRPYWGTVIGIYEGVKGVKMPFSEQAYEKMGIDGGGQGGTSGGYDHMGYSVLMNTREPQIAPAGKVPTELKGKIEYDGKTIDNNELGAINNTYKVDKNKALPKGKTLTLKPLLPEGEEDTGNWKWNTGETTRDITVTTDKSYAYRATYTNKNGIESQQVFTIAVNEDANPMTKVNGYITYNGKEYTDSVTVYYGETVNLTLQGPDKYVVWGSYEWDNGATTNTITTAPIVRPRDITGVYINQAGVRTPYKFHINVKYMQVQTKVNGVVKPDTTDVTVNIDDNVEIGPYVSKILPGSTFLWNTGETTPTLTFNKIKESGTYTLDYEVNGEKGQLRYEVLVNDTVDIPIAEGDYMIFDRFHNTYLTANKSAKCTMTEKNEDDILSQVWHFTNNGTAYNNLQSAKYEQYLRISAKMDDAVQKYPFAFRKAIKTEFYEIHNYIQSYWGFKDDGTISLSKGKDPTTYPLMLIPYTTNAIDIPTATNGATTIYNIMGQKLTKPHRGINIINGKKVMVK